MRVLVIEDDAMQAEILRETLCDEGYAVDLAYTGEEGESLALSIQYDAILADNQLPGKRGFEVCQTLRQMGIKTPIIIMSGFMIGDTDIIKGLDCGADEYLTKPVPPRVLTARIRALLRKQWDTKKVRLEIGNVILDTIYRQIWQGPHGINLTEKEYAFFEYLAYHAEMVVTREELEQHCYNMSLDADSNIVDQHIKNLRRKLGDGVLIETVRGMGYRLRKSTRVELSPV